MLSPFQLRLLTSFKAAFSAVIAIGLAMGFGWDRPYWAGISTMVVTLPYMGAALEKSMMRIVGTMLAGFALYMISWAFPQAQLGYCFLLAIALIWSGYFGAGTWYPYTFMLFGITITILVTDTFQQPDDLWPYVFFRVSEICLGVTVALMVNAAFWPQNAGRAFLTLVATELESCRKLFVDSSALAWHDEGAEKDRAKLEESITGGLAKLHPLLLQAQRDSSQVARHRRAFQDFLHGVEDLFITLTVLRRAAEAHYPKGYRDEMLSEMDAFTEAIDSLFKTAIQGMKDGKPFELPSADAAGQVVDDKIQELRSAEVNLKYPIEDTTHLYALLANLFDVKKALDCLNAIVLEINGGPARPKEEVTNSPGHAGIDWRRFQHGVKIAIACIGSLYAWKWLQWSGGGEAVVTAGIVMQKSMVASSQKAILRLGGCLFGGTCGALSLIFLEPYFSTYTTFCVPLFVFFMIFSWINFGPARYAYAGFQSFLTFLLMTSVSNTQNVSLLPAVDRFMGILLGVLITLLVLRLFWPLIPEREVRKDLGRFFGRAKEFLTEYTPLRVKGQPASEALQMLALQVTPIAASVESWLGQIAMKDEVSARNRLRRFALASQTLGYRLRALEQTFQRDMPEPLRAKLAPCILEINELVIHCLDILETSFKDCRAPTEQPDFDSPLRNLTHTIYKLFREDKIGRPYSGQQVAGVLGMARRYRALANETRTCMNLAYELDYTALNRTPFL